MNCEYFQSWRHTYREHGPVSRTWAVHSAKPQGPAIRKPNGPTSNGGNNTELGVVFFPNLEERERKEAAVQQISSQLPMHSAPCVRRNDEKLWHQIYPQRCHRIADLQLSNEEARYLSSLSGSWLYVPHKPKEY